MGDEEAKEVSEVVVKSVTKSAGKRGSSGLKPTLKLKDSARDSYKDFKMMLSYLPQKVRKAIESTTMSREAISNINNSIGNIRSGVWSTLPVVCAGPRCAYTTGGRCELQNNNVAPIGMDCPLEQYLQHTWMDEYMGALQVTPQHKIEMGQIGTMVMCDIIIMRARNWMAQRPDGHVDVHATGIDNKGNVVLSRDISVELKVEEKFDRIRQRNMESLLATRESRAKYDIIEEDDPALAGAKIRFKAQQIIARKAAEGNAIAAKLLAKADYLESAAGVDGIDGAKALAKSQFLEASKALEDEYEDSEDED